MVEEALMVFVAKLVGKLPVPPIVKVVLAPISKVPLKEAGLIENVPRLKVPFVNVNAFETIASEAKVTTPDDCLSMVRFLITFVVPGFELSILKLPISPFPWRIKDEFPPPLIDPFPANPELTPILPKVAVKPFKSKISLALVKVIAFPPLGPSHNKLFSKRIVPVGLLETM